MFAFDATFNAVTRSKRAPMLADFLAFNSTQSKHYDVGRAGEKLAIALLQDNGFKAYKPEEKFAGDIHAVCRHTGELFKIEVKTSLYSETSRKWQFCLNKARHTSTSHSEYILLLCVAKNILFTYLIPSAFLAGMKQLSITARPSNYRGKVAPFLNRGALSFQAASNVMALAMLQ